MNTAVVIAASAGVAAAITAAAITAARGRGAALQTPSRGGATAIRITAGLTTIGLAGIAGAISYQHLLVLATTHGQHGWLGHAFPMSVDGVEIVASLRLLADRRTGQRSGWMPWGALALGTAFSLFANVAVAEPDLTARVIAGWPAIALMIAIKLLSGLLDQHTGTPMTARAAQDAAEPTPEPIPAGPSDPVPVSLSGGDTAADRLGRPRRRGRRDRERLPVDLMRRIPVNIDAYQRWRNLWTDLRSVGADPNALAEAHQVSLRHLQFVRAAGDAGLLDSPVPPAHRVAELTGNTTVGDTPAAPTHHDPAAASR